jgi:hypothetical protein
LKFCKIIVALSFEDAAVIPDDGTKVANVPTANNWVGRVISRARSTAHVTVVNVRPANTCKQAFQRSDKRRFSGIVFAVTIGGWLME